MTQLDPDRYLRLSPKMQYGRDDGLFFDKTTNLLVMVVNGSIYNASGQLLISDGTDLVPVTPSGDWAINAAGVATIAAGAVGSSKMAKPRLRVLTETLLAADLTDGGAADGTATLASTIPAGARYLATTIANIVGFAEDTSAVITVGDGSDVDRYNTGTPSVFTTAAAGVDMGAVSGTAFHDAAKAVVATVTSAADITPVIAGAGSCDLQFWFLEPV